MTPRRSFSGSSAPPRSHTRGAALAVAFLAATACGGSKPSDRARTDSAAQTSGEAPPSSVAAPATRVSVASLGYDYGDVQAPVRVVEMSDFGCGYCRKFQLETWPVLRKEFVATGKVHWKFIPYVTGMFPNSDVATQGAECALEQGPAAFDAMQEKLWREQPVWKKASDAAAKVRGWAKDEGLDLERFDRCISEGHRSARIAEGGALARGLGVRGTPTFFIRGYGALPGALPTETFRRLLNEVYRQAAEQGS